MNDPAPRIRELLRRARDLDQEAEGLRQQAGRILRAEMERRFVVSNLGGSRTPILPGPFSPSLCGRLRGLLPEQLSNTDPPRRLSEQESGNAGLSSVSGARYRRFGCLKSAVYGWS